MNKTFMKVVIITSSILCLGFILLNAADSKVLEQRQFESYADTGQEKSVTLTMHSVASYTSTVTVPAWAQGFKIYPGTHTVRFAVQDGPTGIVISTAVALSSTTINARGLLETDMGIGGIAKPDQWETRLLPYTGRTRYLYLKSGNSLTIIDLEFF